MSASHVRTQQAMDLLAADHLAACGDCGDIAHPTATVCEGCGSPLYPRTTTAPARDSFDERSVQGQKEAIVPDDSERPASARSALASYEPSIEERLMISALDATEKALGRPLNVVAFPGHSVKAS